MSNHVHLVLVPSTEDGLASAVGETHKTYTQMVNKRNGWRGYLWQGRFLSFVLHESYYWTVMRYVELNPVRAGIVGQAEGYRWSSARAHLGLRKDPVLDKAPLLPDWRFMLDSTLSAEELTQIRSRYASGRPLGDPLFVEMIEKEAGLTWTPRKRGPKHKAQGNKVE